MPSRPDFTITAKIRTTQPITNIASKYDWRGRQRGYVFGIGGEGEKSVAPGHLFAWISARTDPFEGVEILGSQKVNDGRDHHVAFVFVRQLLVMLLHELGSRCFLCCLAKWRDRGDESGRTQRRKTSLDRRASRDNRK